MCTNVYVVYVYQVMKVSSSLTEAQSCAAQTLGFEVRISVAYFPFCRGRKMTLFVHVNSDTLVYFPFINVMFVQQVMAESVYGC